MKHITLFLLILPLVVFSQINILNAKSPTEIGKSSIDDEVYAPQNPLDYGFIDEKDVLFSKTIWEEINLDERVNFPLYYPVDTLVVGNERRPMFHYLLKSAINGEYTVYKKDNLKDTLHIDALKEKLKFRRIRPGAGENIGIDRIQNEAGTKEKFLIQNGVDVGEYANIDESSFVRDEDFKLYDKRMDSLIFKNNLLREEEFSEEEVGYADILKYKIKGVWYFDKRQSDLRYRPIAIAPIVASPKSKDQIKEGLADKPEPIELFWVFYPDARQYLHKALAFNNKNTSKPVTFDHLINSRRFSAFIYKEDNVYEDRDINDYITDNALMQLLESQRIKEKIRNLEQDMWSY